MSSAPRADDAESVRAAGAILKGMGLISHHAIFAAMPEDNQNLPYHVIVTGLYDVDGDLLDELVDLESGTVEDFNRADRLAANSARKFMMN